MSAISGTGTGDMLEALLASLPAPKSLQAVEEQEGPLAVAIIGRPNVGESLCLVMACHTDLQQLLCTLQLRTAGPDPDAVQQLACSCGAGDVIANE